VTLQVVEWHFWLKKNEILSQLEEWIGDLELYCNDKRVGRSISHSSASLKVCVSFMFVFNPKYFSLVHWCVIRFNSALIHYGMFSNSLVCSSPPIAIIILEVHYLNNNCVLHVFITETLQPASRRVVQAKTSNACR